ncbi:hypothetical protein VDGE_09776 [Verticillium dahliae]|uniref:Rhodopsin domain-containing protein n=1 Tax=Verticillium dahliae TaxID=27337 RepID=A0A444RPX9_VERDA|nr:hypothetical protein VDGE_09776 [Verticillium dahliae]
MSSNTLDNTALLATGICMVILTSAVFGFRLAISLLERRQLAWEDGFLSAAYIVFLVISILYMLAGPTIFRLEDLAAGRIPMYPTIMDDSLRIQKTFFVTTSGLWISLWLVKASLLAVYKRLMVNLRLFTILWWVTVGICILTLAGAITSSMLSCSSMKAWFTAGACGTQRDIEAAYISLWYSYAVDILTDILVMLLPLGLIRNLQMKMSRKLSIAGLFCLGWVCVAVSTIRVAYLGRNAVEGSSFKQPATSWLALWGIVESAMVTEHLRYFQSTISGLEKRDPKTATILRDLEAAVRAANTTQRILRETKLPHDEQLCTLHATCAELIDNVGRQLRLIRKRVFCCAVVAEKYPLYLAKLRKDRPLDKMRADLRECEDKIMARLTVLLAEARNDAPTTRQPAEVGYARRRLRHHDSTESIRSLEAKIEGLESVMRNEASSDGNLVEDQPVGKTRSGVTSRWSLLWLWPQKATEQNEPANMVQDEKERDEDSSACSLRPSSEPSVASTAKRTLPAATHWT